MAMAVGFRLNGNGGQVVRDAELALLHLADNLLGGRGEPERLRRAIADEEGCYDYLKPAGAVPHLAGILHRAARAERRESVEIVLHDLDARPGFDGTRVSHDLVNDGDPSYAILDALAAVAEDGADPSDAEEDLAMAVDAAVSTASGFNGTPERALAGLRARMDLVGPPPGHPLRVVPDAVPGEDAAAVVRGLAQAARERFREVMAKAGLDEGMDAPAP